MSPRWPPKDEASIERIERRPALSPHFSFLFPFLNQRLSC
jgi:hypothetical protein